MLPEKEDNNIDYKTEYGNLIADISGRLGKEIDLREVKIIDRGVPHVPGTLPKDHMAVYTFIYQGQFLKIGKVGHKSGARFTSQHYSPNSSISNLASSILKDPDMYHLGLNENTVGDWIKNNCRRVDILMPNEMGIFTLELVEAILHYKYEPKYEGFSSQR